jgi:hypothetical protein
MPACISDSIGGLAGITAFVLRKGFRPASWFETPREKRGSSP